ncbi:MAG: ABC transporter ATP-binding protein [Acetobacteraceae bacterium]|nr:ABC transporter ATP-binding protein [Acetobacteraceae bacterium]
MTALIEIERLSKRFAERTVVDDVSLSVARGEVLGFLGPNGAGKTTTMRMLAGFILPSAGTARIAGFDVLDRPIEARRRLGYLPEGAPSYPDMTVHGFLGFIAAARGFSGRAKAARVSHAVGLTELGDVVNFPIDTLSKGFRRRVGLAASLLHDPETLILDEPTDGLDPNQKHAVRTLIATIAAEKAIIISTHILEEVGAVCSRAVIIARGRVAADDTPAGLLSRSRYHNAVTLTLAPGIVAQAEALLGGLPMVAGIERDGSTLTLLARAGQEIIEAVGNAMADAGLRAHEMRLEQGRLDEVFRAITAAPPALPAPRREAA